MASSSILCCISMAMVRFMNRRGFYMATYRRSALQKAGGRGGGGEGGGGGDGEGGKMGNHQKG